MNLYVENLETRGGHMKLMPAIYCGVMFDVIELWTILEPIPPWHTKNSTVSRRTIESHGYTIEEHYGPLL